MFDRLLAPKFFQAIDFNQVSEIKENLLLTFQLPQTPETLDEFLQTKNGALFVSGVGSLISDLKRWSTEQKLDSEPLDQFYERHFSDYAKGRNKIVFTLFTEGVRLLAKITHLLKNDNLPLELKREVIQHLLTGINVCAPGTFTNIQDAYLSLINNIAIELLSYRRSIAQQTVLTLLKANKYSFHISTAYEIHYVNAVLNAFQKELGIEKIDDTYIKSCNQELINQLCDEFKNAIPKNLTAEAIIKLIISSKIEHLITALIKSTRNSADYYQEMKIFENKLNYYGKDPGFNLSQIIDSETLKLRSDAEYNLIISLLNRLSNSGYFNFKDVFIENTQDEGTLYYSPYHSANVSFYETKDDRISLLVYCGDKDKLISLLRSLNEKDQCQLLKRLGKSFLQKLITDDHALSRVLEKEYISKPSVDFCLTLLNELGSEHLQNIIKMSRLNLYFFRKIMEKIPESIKFSFLRDGLGMKYFNRTLDDVDTLDGILKTISERDYEIFLRSVIGEKTLNKIFNQGWYLCRVPKSVHKTIINLLGMDHFSKIIQQTWELKIVIDNLPAQHRIEFLYEKIRITPLRGLLKCASDIEWLLKRIPQEHHEPLKKQLEFFKISSIQEYKQPAATTSREIMHINDSQSIYDPKVLDEKRIIGSLSSKNYFLHLCIYNKETKNIEKTYENLRIRKLFKLEGNQFVLSFVDSPTIILAEWKNNKLLHINQVEVNLDDDKVEEIISIMPYNQHQLMILTADHMNIVNNYKTWHLQLCDLVSSTCTRMLTVPKDEHCFIRNMELLPDRRTIVGWDQFSDNGRQDICFIDTKDYSVQMIPMNRYSNCRIQTLTPMTNGNLVMTLDNNQQVEIEFEHTKLIKQLPGTNSNTFLNMNSIFSGTTLKPSAVALVVEYLGVKYA